MDAGDDKELGNAAQSGGTGRFIDAIASWALSRLHVVA